MIAWISNYPNCQGCDSTCVGKENCRQLNYEPSETDKQIVEGGRRKILIVGHREGMRFEWLRQLAEAGNVELVFADNIRTFQEPAAPDTIWFDEVSSWPAQPVARKTKKPHHKFVGRSPWERRKKK